MQSIHRVRHQLNGKFSIDLQGSTPVEQKVQCRSLYSMSEDSQDLAVLTPAYFLISDILIVPIDTS